MPEIVAPPGFTWTKLSEIARLESGHTPSRASARYWNGNVPWVGIRDATSNHGKTIHSTNQYITEDGLRNSSARLLPAETVCLSRTASVGYVVTMGVPMATSQDFVNWVCGPKLDPRYLRYLLMAEQDSIRRFAHGTTHQTMYYPEAKALYVCVPGRSEQRAIADLFGALDDKIAVNSKVVGLLLEHVSAEFELGLAGGAQSLKLADVAAFHNRRRIPLSARERDLRPGAVPYYGASGVFGSVDESLFDEQLVLVGEDGSVMTDRGTPVIQYIWGPAWVNNHAHVLQGTMVSTELLYFAVTRKNVSSLVTGAVQPKLSMGNLKSLDLELPRKEHLPRLEYLVSTEMAMLRSLREENKRLEMIRDGLLPQLMSGKIRVKDAEKTLEEVL